MWTEGLPKMGASNSRWKLTGVICSICENGFLFMTLLFKDPTFAPWSIRCLQREVSVLSKRAYPTVPVGDVLWVRLIAYVYNKRMVSTYPIFIGCCLSNWWPRTIALPHYNEVIMRAMASPIASPRMFAQPFIQAQIKENIEAPRHWPLCGEFTVDRWIHHETGIHAYKKKFQSWIHMKCIR